MSHRFFNVSQDSGLSQSPYDLNPPPLPPKKKSLTPPNVFQPSLMVRNPSNPLHPGFQNGSGWRQQQRHRVEVQRNSILSSEDEEEDEFQTQRRVPSVCMNEPFPAELDFAQVIGHSQFNASQPPPPPPRDPKRRLYLSGQDLDSRPVSYSFEKQPDVVQKSSQVPPVVQTRVSRPFVKEIRQNRANSAPNYFSASVPDLVRPMEYWKSPPLPYVPTFDPYLEKNSINSAPPRPPRPNLKKKLSDTSSRGRDSAIGLSPALITGKSSPSSSSVTSSRDSGYPLLPLSSVQENNNIDYDTTEDVDIIHVEAEETEETTESLSPPRTNENHPGFSSKARRSLFRAAINEIEDAFNLMNADADLLDRAERRDLPTAHQELIAQARSQDTTSLNTSTEMLFSDMDNFMNWNTSSSFENIPETRQRTPARRRSGAPDKVQDDVVNRICRDSNKKIGENDPGVKFNQSYLILSPALTPASSFVKLENTENEEPDVFYDDYHLRQIRDSQNRLVQDSHQFGIPKDSKLISGASSQDYLHAVPDLNRYRSTFNPMRNPDQVLDDLAFRALRKDSNQENPASLGIVKDPNRLITPSSCWKHKMESKLNEKSEVTKFPAVHYPDRNKKLLQTLASDIGDVIKRSSSTPNGGKEAKVVTYEDLLKDPVYMESMKKSLGIEDHVKNEEMDEFGKPKWAGKTLYELFKKTENKEESPPPLQEITINHVQVENPSIDPSQFHSEEKKDSIVSELLKQSQSSSILRHQERVDSSNEESCEKGEQNICWQLANPALIAACYCLALLHQMGGLDFLSLLGVVLAMISMVSMFFL